ncbi:MAG TPA: SRPBCC domain-containing protein [Candidatus Saccharimonadales bacterium]|nr:SRPBCC domain-containing protein [Candidatus Saccharimonadales bacterium]
MAEQRIKLEARQSVFVRATRERVYDAFATAEGLDGWFTRGSRIDARPGGALLFRWVDWGAEKDITADVPGRVIEAKRPERLVFEWGEPGSESTVEIVFEARDGGTLVKLREFGFRTVENVVENAGGWGEALTLAKFWLEHGIATNTA